MIGLVARLGFMVFYPISMANPLVGWYRLMVVRAPLVDNWGLLEGVQFRALAESGCAGESVQG